MSMITFYSLQSDARLCTHAAVEASMHCHAMSRNYIYISAAIICWKIHQGFLESHYIIIQWTSYIFAKHIVKYTHFGANGI